MEFKQDDVSDVFDYGDCFESQVGHVGQDGLQNGLHRKPVPIDVVTVLPINRNSCSGVLDPASTPEVV